jgi:vacuolar-type H+-ATPase subunit H
MYSKAGTMIIALSLLVLASTARAQSLVTTLTLGPNQIGLVKTTPGITTRITFSEPVKEIICGDLYDTNSGKGSFVVQRSDNDVFLKPVVPKGLSNLFVKTGERGENVYSLDLVIVPTAEAYRMVTVARGEANPANGSQQSPAADQTASETAAKNIAAAQKQAEDILANARGQAGQIVAQAEKRAVDSDRHALQRSTDLERRTAERTEQEIQRRFIRAMIQGVRDVRVNDSHVAPKRIEITLDPRMLTFDEKSYLRYTIKNNSDKEFAFSSLSLERSSGKEKKEIPAEINQGRVENKLKAGESVIGIIVFDSKLVTETDKLTLFVRGEGNIEIARLNIQ